MSAPTDQDGLRARKKQRTRAALIDAGLDLFAGSGYESTTVDEIAAAADVSPRTFFRYFASKEDLALAKGAEFDVLVVDALAGRPAAEPPLAALRGAVLEMLHAAADGDGVHRYLLTQHLITKNPALLAGNLRRSAEVEEQLTAEIARRQDLDPAADLRPRVLVGVVFAGLRIGLEAMCADPRRDAERMLELVREAVDLATAGIPERFSGGPGSW
ncbi:TetR family transcriptional regulator [Saccharopolyspora sp. HNM0983]|uniref:TetR family transcriptional regulator n=1 Tax=Saccharopolyspora montiporae TaxID=2781240 RepID=A0A929BCT0_9PSEU|nr:TetR family transcriptional regulator [Saccharopolyspora sp. HNM0983]MBE9375243.1 TetR family transcriptional regulator [Saccharopolyspora sp. HNM0983]